MKAVIAPSFSRISARLERLFGGAATRRRLRRGRPAVLEAFEARQLLSAVGLYHFDELDGSVAGDASGNGNAAALVGAAAFAAGHEGNALSLTTAGGYAQVVSTAALNPTAQITVAAWINADVWGANRRIVQKGTADNQYRLLAENGALKFDIRNVGSVTTALPSVGAWHHVAGTYDGSMLKIYVDGQLVVTKQAGGSIPTGGSAVAIGNKPGSTAAGDRFLGKIDEVLIDNVALSANEIGVLAGTATALPAVVTLVSGRATSGTGVLVSWAGSARAESYVVEASTDGVNFAAVGSVGLPGMLVTGLTTSTGYRFRVSAVNGAGSSAGVVSAVVTTLATDTTGVYYVGSVDGGSDGSLVLHGDTGSYTTYNQGLRLTGDSVVAGSMEEAVLKSVAGYVLVSQTGRT